MRELERLRVRVLLCVRTAAQEEAQQLGLLVCRQPRQQPLFVLAVVVVAAAAAAAAAATVRPALRRCLRQRGGSR